MAEIFVFSVDRIEGDVAVLEDNNGDCRNVSVAELPPETAEGSVLRWTADGYVIADMAAESRRQRVFSLQERLRKKNST